MLMYIIIYVLFDITIKEWIIVAQCKNKCIKKVIDSCGFKITGFEMYKLILDCFPSRKFHIKTCLLEYCLFTIVILKAKLHDQLVKKAKVLVYNT